MSDFVKISELEESEYKPGLLIPVVDLTESDPADQNKTVTAEELINAVAAPLNNVVYLALLNPETPEEAPTVIEKVNLTGETITWTRTGLGEYQTSELPEEYTAENVLINGNAVGGYPYVNYYQLSKIYEIYVFFEDSKIKMQVIEVPDGVADLEDAIGSTGYFAIKLEVI
jgi:hypothetical protein